MGRKKKLALIALGLAFSVSASLLCAALYYYYRPATTKALLEEFISRLTGTVCTIENLSYSLQPPRVNAKGVLLVGHVQGFLLEIPELSAGIALRGPFGQKTLAITQLKVKGFSLITRQETSFQKIQPPQEGPRFFGDLIRAVVGSLLFRDINIEGMQMTEGHVVAEFGDIRVTLNSLRGGTTQDQRLEITSEARVEWPSQRIALLAQEIYLSSDQVLTLDQPEVMGDFNASKVRLEHPGVTLDDVSVQAKLIYEHDKETLNFQPLEIHVNKLLLPQHPATVQAPLKGSFLGRARLDLASRKMLLPEFHLILKDVLDLTGALSLEGAEKVRLQLIGMDGSVKPESVEPFLPDLMKKSLAPFKITGPVGIHGDMALGRKQNRETLDVDLELQLTGNEVTYSSPALLSQGRVTGKWRASGAFPALRSSIAISCDPIALRTDWVHAQGGRLSLSVEGEGLSFQIGQATLSLPELKVTAGRTDVLLTGVQSHLQEGSVDFEKGVFTVQNVELQTSLLRNLRVSVNRAEHETRLEVSGKDTHLLESLHALTWIDPVWRFSGRDSLQARLTLQDGGGGGWKGMCRLNLDGSRFENASLDWAGENISTALTLEASGNLDRPPASWKTSIEVTNGEILLGRFYFDMGKNDFALSGDGICDYANKAFQVSGLRMALNNVVALNGQGIFSYSPDSEAYAFEASIPRTDVAPLFRHFILEPFGKEKAFLSNLDVKGSLSADLELRSRQDDFTVKGHCRWDEGSVESLEGGFSLRGIDLDLPIWVQGRGRPEDSGSPVRAEGRLPRRPESVRGETIEGGLAIGSSTLPLLPPQRFSFHLEASPNQLFSTSPIPMEVPGGEIEWGPFVLNDPLSPAFSLTTSLSVDHVQLGQILTEVWGRPLRGSVRGKLKRVEISGDQIASEGKIEADFFGGNLSIMNPGAHGIFSITPVVYLDARWKGLLLGELTEGTPFGKVEGVLNGQASGVEIAQAEPQKFDLFLETVPRAGVPQLISTKAVDNISQIGGGQGALTGVFASFFKEFPYEKIGIHASLENDHFRINGTIKEGGKEYLVKRAGFSGVNVVNQNPDNLISFKDMVKRIKRVASSGREPTVK